MRDLSKKNSTVRILLVAGFCTLILILLTYSFDLNDLTKQKRDKLLLENAIRVLKQEYDYFKIKGQMPWAFYTGAKVSSPGLGWTLVSSPEVGLCEDDACISSGEVQRVAATLEGKIKLGKSDKVFIGKGVDPQDPLHVCFIPLSKAVRKNTANLYRVDLGSKAYPPQKLEYCSDRVTWEDIDQCYVCVSGQQ